MARYQTEHTLSITEKTHENIKPEQLGLVFILFFTTQTPAILTRLKRLSVYSTAAL